MLEKTSWGRDHISIFTCYQKGNVLWLPLAFFAFFLLMPIIAASQSPSTREKVHLHLDRSIYAAGDTIWFKAYTVLAGTNELSATSKILHADLHSSSGTRIARLQLPIRSGLSNGDIALPDTLKEGRYRLRAYTTWMRNFGDSTSFEKNITVINGLNTVGQNTADKSTSKLAPDVQFFPEGGDLVTGIRSRVGVKVTSPEGKGIAAEGDILDAEGNTLAKFMQALAPS
jgi:hypothetical protein